MRILVTGSNGFVGRELVSTLRLKGNFVREFDLPEKDLLNAGQCIEAAKGIDIVFHLAAVLDEDNPMLWKANVDGTKNILEASAKAHAKQFVFLSTVGVYGKAKQEINEETALMPETKYEKSKAEAEKIVLEFQEMIPLTIIRAALVMGANSYWKNIVWFIKKDFPLPGNGLNTFQTIFIRDLIPALLFVMNNENAMGETFIVAGKEKIKLIELCEKIRQELGLEGKQTTIPAWQAKILAYLNLVKNKLTGKKSLLEPAYINRLLHERNYDTSKINKLGWKQKYAIEEAIKETIGEIKNSTSD